VRYDSFSFGFGMQWISGWIMDRQNSVWLEMGYWYGLFWMNTKLYAGRHHSQF